MGRIGGTALAVEEGQSGLGHILPKDHHPHLTTAEFLAVGHGLQAGEFNEAGADDHGEGTVPLPKY
jgi:hypothetical protein